MKKEIENASFFTEWDPIAHLNKLHTRQIMQLRKEALMFCNNQTTVDPGGWCVITLDQINQILTGREHIPNKAEAKEIRRQKAHSKRNR